MREIKFRGKVIANPRCYKIGDWAYGDLVRGGDGNVVILTPHDGSLEWSGIVDEKTVGQFTGLHDKNGKRIYEGDIVQERGLRETWALSRRDEFSERKHVITWCDYDLQWCGKLIEDDEDYELDTRNLSFLERKYTLEIIGNIHDKGEMK